MSSQTDYDSRVHAATRSWAQLQKIAQQHDAKRHSLSLTPLDSALGMESKLCMKNSFSSCTSFLVVFIFSLSDVRRMDWVRVEAERERRTRGCSRRT